MQVVCAPKRFACKEVDDLHACEGGVTTKTEICLVFNGLPSANRRTLGKELVCRVLDPGALGKPKALGKITICRVSTLGKEIHSVNDHFA